MEQPTNKIHIVVDEVTYEDGGRWTRFADGGGSSLELMDARSDKRLAPNWADSNDSNKSGRTTDEFTGLLDHGAMANADQLHLILLGEGECLVDNVEVIPSGGGNVVANSTFESGTSGWFFQGTHDESYWETSAGFNGLVAGLLLQGLAPGEAMRMAERLGAVSPEAAADVARRYVTPGQASAVIVGNAAAFLEDLRKIRPDVIVIPAAELDLSSSDLGA